MPRVTLPYGLSDQHREIRTSGKARGERPFAGPRWYAPSLRQLSSSPNVLPILNVRKRSQTPPIDETRKLEVRKVRQVIIMGVATPNSHKAKASSSLERTKRKERPKSRVQVAKVNRKRPSDVRRKFDKAGTSREAPINIDDDDDEEYEMEGLMHTSYTPCDAFRSAVRTPTPSSRIYAPSINSSPSSASASTGSETSYSNGFRTQSILIPSVARARAADREQSIYAGPARLSKPIPSSVPQEIRSPLLRDRASMQRRPLQDADQVVNLGDITDFEMRKNVADLMAVAPGLAVKELYGLLVDMEGDLPAARRQVISRTSQTLSFCLPIKPERMQSAALPKNFVNLAEDSDSDEIMVKIDPNAPFLEYDTDTPPPEMTRMKKATVTKRNSSFTRSNKAPARRRRDRENSIVRDFLAPDNEVEYHTDKSSSVESERHDISDEESSLEVEHEDPEDLRIDMRRKYVFNAAILRQWKKKSG